MGARQTALGACVLTLWGCDPAPAVPSVAQRQPDPAPPAQIVFVDRAAETGIDYFHFHGGTGEYYTPEITGPGVALFDYDGDGDLDVYVVQGAMLTPGATVADADIPPANGEKEPANRLYRNEIVPQGVLRFSDVTEASGLGDTGYGQGVAIGDTDNDGDPDVFLANFGANEFYENNGDGTFRRRAGAVAVAEERWTTSASFADIDADGRLDLFATNYVAYTLDNHRECLLVDEGTPEYCGPEVFLPSADHLWRNGGDNRFVDISEKTGIAAAAGSGLGVCAADLNGDARIDFYVSNDLLPNHMFIQTADGRFEERALMAGAAFNANGVAEASMGLTVGDFDGDGDEDMFMTHLTDETNTLYVNDGRGNFFDFTDGAGLGMASRRLTGFGTAWLDYDNDGLLDLYVANGAVISIDDEGVDRAFPFGQINQLFHNEGGVFRDASGEAGAANALKETSRGTAIGDVDNDGDLDVLVSNANGPLRLFINELDNDRYWLRVKLRGVDSNRDGAGARVVLRRADGTRLWRRAHTDGSYLSASDIRVHLGLGDDPDYDAIGVVWPSGRREQWRGLGVDREVSLVEGEGAPWSE